MRLLRTVTPSRPPKLSGEGNKQVQNMVLVDLTPLTLGIESLGEIMNTVIPRNTSIPTKKEKIVTTVVDNQKEFLFLVYEGERTRSKDNNPMDKFQLSNIPPAPKGVPEITICFEIDYNGILTVSAKHKEAGKMRKITITNGHAQQGGDSARQSSTNWRMANTRRRWSYECIGGFALHLEEKNKG